jgi:hypothetical protein
MSNFYNKRLMPQPGDTSAAPRAYLGAVEAIMNVIGDGNDRRRETRKDQLRQAEREIFEAQKAALKDEAGLHLAQYRNAAMQASVEAYGANRTDIEAYKRDFRERMRAYDVPINRQAKYGAAVEGIESQYYWTIAANREASTKQAIKSAVTEQTNAYVAGSVSLLDGETQDPLPSVAVGEKFHAATEGLYTNYADGSPVFDNGERAELMDSWNGQVLTASMERDLTENSTTNDLLRMKDPNFDYRVTVQTDTGPMEFSRAGLSPARKNQFNGAVNERLQRVLRTANDREKLAYGQQIWRGEIPFFSGDSRDKKALEIIAEAETVRNPITNNTLDVHMHMAQTFVERFNFLPKAYARAITALVSADNPKTAAMGSIFLGTLSKSYPTATKVFDDETLLRASLIADQIAGGTTAENALARANKALDPNGRAGLEVLKQSLRNQTRGARASNFYGNGVNPEIYGHQGVQDFRRMVDSYFLINGGDRKGAVAVAKARLDAEFSETRIGADGTWHMPFLGAKRRKYRNTPESVYGPNAAEPINAELEMLAPSIERMGGIPCDLRHITLVATPETDRAVELGEDPTWLLLRKNDDGTSQFYTDEEGNPLSYSLSTGVKLLVYFEGPKAVNNKVPLPEESVPTFLTRNPAIELCLTKEISNGQNAPGESDKIPVAQLIRDAWVTPSDRKREFLKLINSSLEAVTPSKATKERKEFDATRKNGK